MTQTCPQCGFTNLVGDRACVRCRYQFVAVEPEAPAAPPAYVSAGFAPRAVARLIDFAAAQLCGPAAGGILLAFLGFDRWSVLESLDIPFPFDWLLGIVVVLTYQTTTESIAGTSLGKLLLGLRVVQENRTPITFQHALLRNLWFYVDCLIFGVPAYISMSNSPLRQRIGDKRAQTLVLKRRDVPEASRPGVARMIAGIAAAIALVGLELAALLTTLMPAAPNVPTA